MVASTIECDNVTGVTMKPLKPGPVSGPARIRYDGGSRDNRREGGSEREQMVKAEHMLCFPGLGMRGSRRAPVRACEQESR